MAKIKVDVDHPIYDGANVTFKAPCDCTSADGLTVSYPGGSKTFTLCDSHGVNISGINDVFAKGVPVKAILDVSNSKAFVQNGDNNSFIASVISRISDSQHVAYGSYVGTGSDPGNGYAVTLNFDFTPKFLLIYSDIQWESDFQWYESIDFGLFVKSSALGIVFADYVYGGKKSWSVETNWGETSVSFGRRYYFPEEWDEEYGGEPYNEHDYMNLDDENTTYHYVAIG